MSSIYVCMYKKFMEICLCIYVADGGGELEKVPILGTW